MDYFKDQSGYKKRQVKEILRSEDTWCCFREVLWVLGSGLMGSVLDREVMGQAQIKVAFPIVQKFQSNRVIFN